MTKHTTKQPIYVVTDDSNSGYGLTYIETFIIQRLLIIYPHQYISVTQNSETTTIWATYNTFKFPNEDVFIGWSNKIKTQLDKKLQKLILEEKDEIQKIEKAIAENYVPSYMVEEPYETSTEKDRIEKAKYRVSLKNDQIQSLSKGIEKEVLEKFKVTIIV